jgi:predicted DNA-binding transcriptional regulator YafY
MTGTTGRVLRLLTLLQSRRVWTATALSERLSVDARTIRRDIDRLRELGYVIDSSAGPGGGYRLRAGNATPPLLLEDEEAVAIVAALTAAAGSIASTEEVTLRILVKLDQLLPARLKRRLSTLQAITVPLIGGRAMADPAVLTKLAGACHDHEAVRFTYKDRDGQVTQRSVEPAGLVHTGRVWYLAAWDRDRSEWRTFRVDRIDAKATLTRGQRFDPRQLPMDVAAYVSKSISSIPYRYMVRLRLSAGVADLKTRVPPWLGSIEPISESECILTIGAETLEMIAGCIAYVGVDFSYIEPPELAEPLRAIAHRFNKGLLSPHETGTTAHEEPQPEPDLVASIS